VQQKVREFLVACAAIRHKNLPALCPFRASIGRERARRPIAGSARNIRSMTSIREISARRRVLNPNFDKMARPEVGSYLRQRVRVSRFAVFIKYIRRDGNGAELAWDGFAGCYGSRDAINTRI
jgi:hypothetical protein